ncbi:hypothetical protein [Methanobrevibacter sp.]|uniref:hypothetical protein n=1 Tax=Methanobrevibacter sp. TaxID=66852 RepID=UPI00386506AE
MTEQIILKDYENGVGSIDINRKKSLMRSNELDEIALEDMRQKSKVRTRFSEFSKKLYAATKNKILKQLNASEEDWINPKWQLKKPHL